MNVAGLLERFGMKASSPIGRALADEAIAAHAVNVAAHRDAEQAFVAGRARAAAERAADGVRLSELHRELAEVQARVDAFAAVAKQRLGAAIAEESVLSCRVAAARARAVQTADPAIAEAIESLRDRLAAAPSRVQTHEHFVGRGARTGEKTFETRSNAREVAGSMSRLRAAIVQLEVLQTSVVADTAVAIAGIIKDARAREV